MLDPDANFWRYLVYLKYWTRNLMALMVYPKVLCPQNFSIKAVLLPEWITVNLITQHPVNSKARFGGPGEMPRSVWATQPSTFA